MNAWLSARRIKKGQEEEFRSKWRGGRTPEGMLDAFLLQDEEDPRETLSISFWDTADQLLKYRTSENAKKRHDDLSGVVDKDRWSRPFVAFSSLDIPTRGGGKKWLMLPLLLIGAGAAAYFLLARRGKGGADEWESWEPEPASTFQPGDAPGAFDRDSHNGDRRTAPAPATAAHSGAQPASMQT
ncbi:MAG: antibiotic biosynthesis monooxygenase family protein, partial [Dehalococcoidia bacterium]